MKVKLIFASLLIALIVFVIVYSKKCPNKDEVTANEFPDAEWTEIVQKEKNYVFRCDKFARKIKITNNNIYLKLQEQNQYKILRIDHTKEEYNLFFENSNWHYKLSWIDKEKGIAKWDYINEDKVVIEFSFLTINNKSAHFAKLQKEDCTEVMKNEKNNYDIFCELRAVSKNFNFIITGTKIEDNGVEVIIAINDKNGKKLQEIEYAPNLWESTFGCNAVNYNDTSTFAKDTKYDFVVADFNFDGYEDFAIVYDIGSYNSFIYSFFVQNYEKKIFFEDANLPFYQSTFPKVIDNKEKKIIIENAMGCCKIETTTHNLIDETWKSSINIIDLK